MENETNVVNIDDARPENHLNTLARKHFEAKQAVAIAAQRLADAENELLVAVGSKPEGAKTEYSRDFKITTTGKINRKLDADDVKQLYFDQKIPEAIYNRLFSWVPRLNLKELRYVENNEPEFFREIERVMTTSPAKTSVFVTPIDKGATT